MIPANDNDKRWSLRPLKSWTGYDRLDFAGRFGPIGIKGGSFEYLDPEISEWRA